MLADSQDARPPRRRAPEELQRRLVAPVDISSLVAFRVMFGAILTWEVWRYFDHGWIAQYYIEPAFHFKYYGFGWVKPWPGDGMHLHFALLGLLGVCITIGFMYRLATALCFLALTYVFLLDQAHYLNHIYLVCLVTFLMIFLPAHGARSVDARLRPRLRRDAVPAWPLWLLRAQIGIVYVFAAIAKLNGDWLRARPLDMWLRSRRDDPIFGALFEQDWAPWLFSYSGLLMDGLLVPLLLWRRTRIVALAAAVSFHLLNARLFSIGIFPWFMIAATLLFLDPDWPRRLVGRRDERPVPPAPPGAPSRRARHAIMALLAGYLAVQVLVPLRHFLYPGRVHWTEEGHRFAWHMKLRDKSGVARFYAMDRAGGRMWEIDPELYLTRRQRSKMSRRPDMILQFAHYVAAELRAAGQDVEIHVDAQVSLNGRERRPMIDRSVDLAREPRSLWPAKWILPLTEPLPPIGGGAREPGADFSDD